MTIYYRVGSPNHVLGMQDYLDALKVSIEAFCKDRAQASPQRVLAIPPDHTRWTLKPARSLRQHGNSSETG
jgi:hypothetical protein